MRDHSTFATGPWAIVSPRRIMRDLLVEAVGNAVQVAIACEAIPELLGAVRRGQVSSVLIDHDLLRGGGSGGVFLSTVAGMNVRIVAYGGPSEPEAAYRVLHSGAAGYLSRNASLADVTAAARLVAGGEQYIDAAVRLDPQMSGRSQPNGVVRRLTASELKVLELVADGVATEEIARQLSISPSTVKLRIRNACDKLGVANRTAAVVLLAGQSLV